MNPTKIAAAVKEVLEFLAKLTPTGWDDKIVPAVVLVIQMILENFGSDEAKAATEALPSDVVDAVTDIAAKHRG